MLVLLFILPCHCLVLISDHESSNTVCLSCCRLCRVCFFPSSLLSPSSPSSPFSPLPPFCSFNNHSFQHLKLGINVEVLHVFLVDLLYSTTTSMLPSLSLSPSLPLPSPLSSPLPPLPSPSPSLLLLLLTDGGRVCLHGPVLGVNLFQFLLFLISPSLRPKV